MAKFIPSFKTKSKSGHENTLWQRVSTRWNRMQLDRAAKRKACLTECGKTLTADQQVLKLGFGLLFEALTLILGLIFIWFNVIFFFLKAESVELSFLKPNAAMWFSQKFEGQNADVESVRIDFRKDTGALAFIANEVSVASEISDGVTIAHMEAEFDIRALAFGRFIPQDVKIDGGAVTVKRSDNGDIAIGLGTPQSLGRLGSDIIIEARNDESTRRTNETWRRVQSADLTGANVYLIDEKEGLEWTLTNVDVDYSNSNGQLEGRIGTNLLSQDTTTPLKVKFQSNADFSLWNAQVDLAGVNPSKLASKSKRLPRLSVLNAKLDARIDVAVSRETGLERLEMDIDIGQGVWQTGVGEMAFKPGGLKAIYDADLNRVEVKEIKIDTPRLRFNGSGVINPTRSEQKFSVNTPLDLNFALTDVLVDRGETFEGPMVMKTVDLNAGLDPKSRRLDLGELALDFDAYQVQFSGSVMSQTDKIALKEVDLRGSAQGTMSPQTVLFHWPETLAVGARAWVKRSVLSADVDSLEFKSKFTKESLDRGYLTNDEFSLVFPIRNATVQYIESMTPLTEAVGFGQLYGNSFMIEVSDGQIGKGIDVGPSKVTIPKFIPKDDKLTVDINGFGGVTDILSLIDQPPFGYAKRFGLAPQAYGGSGTFNFVYSRPVKTVYSQQETDFSVSADLQNVFTPIRLGDNRLEDGRLSLEIDKRGLSLGGPVRFGPIDANVYVDNRFGADGGQTDYTVSGSLDRDDLDRLGIGFREYFSGEIDFEIGAKGKALSVNKANFTADLRQAELKFENIWSKERGQAATLSATVETMPDGGAFLDAISVDAENLTVLGSAQFAKDLRLLRLNLSTLKLGGFIDGQLDASAVEAGKLDVKMSGTFLNLSPWVGAALSFQNTQSDLPVTLKGDFSSLLLREDFEIESAQLGYLNSGDGLQEINLTGTHLKTAFAAKMSPSLQGDSRNLFIEIPDTGAALRSFYNLDTMQGGKLIIEARLPPLGAPGPMTGQAKIDDFQIRNIPAFARVLSLASLQGLGDALNGDGIKFQSLIAPFEYEDGLLTLGESRASGAALGLTASGTIDFEGKAVDLGGVIVPAYTLNSVLGNVPILGDIVVGKKGEGIFALNYSVDGPFEKTQVSVNPLSAFTPGFLRQIFQPVIPDKPEEKMETEKEP